MISSELLNLINDMARMHQLAQQGAWERFQPIEAQWLVRFQQALEEEKGLTEQEKQTILMTLLQQVQEIEQYVMQAMTDLKQSYRKEQRQHQAIEQYLNL